MEWHLVQKDPHEMLKLIKVLYIQIFKIKYTSFWKGNHYKYNKKVQIVLSFVSRMFVLEWTVWRSLLVMSSGHFLFLLVVSRLDKTL